MKFIDQLSVFSVPDLRVMAERRGIRLNDAILKNRQTLVRTLAGAMERYDSVYSTLGGLNRAELETLRALLKPGKKPGLSGLSTELQLSPASMRIVLDELRLWGLVFPEGNWDHIVVPSQTQMAHHYLPSAGRQVPDLRPPAQVLLNTGDHSCTARPGSIGRDLAEFLARVARSRMKLTQAGRMNRRDLKGMETAFGVETAGYPVFLSMLAGALGLIVAHPEGLLGVAPDVDDLLGQPELTRSHLITLAWVAMQGYAENVAADPAEYEYVPAHLNRQRGTLLSLTRELPWGKAITIESLHQRLVWQAPMSFQQWDASRDGALVASRMARSLYWLGALAVDHPERPKHASLTALGARLAPSPETGVPPLVPPLVPEETRFFLQPNSEIFTPPNLAPRTLLHVRRITGEKKGGPAGMYPLSTESLRRALDTGTGVDTILAFLERFSRTGLPSNVRALVETTGRQHGRIRLVPTGYVVVTDTPDLMEELRRLKTVEPVLGAALTERAAALAAAQVPELMRNLRARGYAPVNQAETVIGPQLPAEPDEAPPPLSLPSVGGPGLLLSGFEDGETDEDDEQGDELQAGERTLNPAEEVAALISEIAPTGDVAALIAELGPPDEDWEVPKVSEVIEDPDVMLDLLHYSWETGEILEAALMSGSPAGEEDPFSFWVEDIGDRSFLATSSTTQRDHRIKLVRLEWMCRTGELCPE